VVQKLNPHPPPGQAGGSPGGLAASRPNRGMMGARGGQGGGGSRGNSAQQ
jgi:hypothetical protein